MARNYVRYRPNRGLNIVQPKAALNAGQCYRAENVVFTRKSVKRRRGKLASHKVALTSVAAAVTMLKRFYNLATTGTVSKVFLKAFGALLYGTTTDWSDDTRTPITTAQWTNIPYPNTANNSLYDGYSSTTSVPLSGGISSAVASKSWCYIQSNVSSSDDNGKTTAVAVRTQGGKAFLHGLPPPVVLDSADISGVSDIPADSTWTIEEIDSNTPTQSGQGCLRIGSDGKIHAVWIRSANPYYNVRSVLGVWGTPTQVSAVTMATSYGSISMDLDADDNVHIGFYDQANTQIYYATNKSGSFVAEVADTAGAVGSFNAIAVDQSGLPHLVYFDDTNDRLVHSYRDVSGTWSSPAAIKTVANSSFAPSIAFDADGKLHAIFTENPTVGNDNLWYAIRTAAGSWGTASQFGPTADDTAYPMSMALDSDGNPGVVYNNVTDTALEYIKYDGASWGSEEVIDGASQDSCGIAFDPSDSAHVFYENNTNNFYTNRYGGTWQSAVTITSIGGLASTLAVLGIQVSNTYTVHIGTTSGTVQYGYVTGHLYHYRLTAEYDNGILGESGTNGFTQVGYANPVSGGFAHTIALNSGSGVYDMTDDVSKIHVYRTVEGATSAGPYYRVGSVSCSSGAPSADFSDNVNDADLVLNRILDVDRYMPPKWLTGVIWKDRMVIGNLKCRDISTSEGSIDSLDLEDDGIHKNRIRFSEAFHPDVYKANFFQDILPDGDSGSIKRLIVNPQSDSLFVFMENDVVALTDPVGDLVTALSYRPRNVANSHGTPARHSVVEYEGLIFYWTKNGIEVINGLTARNITSDTIGNLWNMTNSNHPAYASRINMSQISKVAGTAHVDEAGERIYWAYPAASNSYNNRVLVLDFARWRDSGFNDDGVFSIWTMDISCWARWDGEGDRGELFGGEALNTRGPWVHRVGISNQDEVGNTSGTITTSAVSPFYIHTGHDDAGTAERRKRWITARVDGRIPTVASTGSCSVALAFDVDEGAVSGTMDTVTWTQGGIKRYSRNLPRAAIGVHGAVEITGTDGTPGASGGSPPFELYEIAMTVQDMEARTARG